MRRAFARVAYVVAVVTLAVAPAIALAQQKSKSLPRPPDPRLTQRQDRSSFGVIDGTVSDTNLVPLVSAQVSVLRVNVKIATNAAGRFRFVDVPAGQYLLIVRRLGYRPTSGVVDVPAGDTVRLSYTLERVAQTLGAVVVTEQRHSLRLLEFDQRRKSGAGEFITSEDLDRRASTTTADILKFSKLMTVTPDNTNGGSLVALSRREGGGLNQSGVAYCPMLVMLDGVPLPVGFPMELLPSPREVAGIEIYGGPATTPPQFAGANSRCGVVLVWTKDGY